MKPYVVLWLTGLFLAWTGTAEDWTLTGGALRLTVDPATGAVARLERDGAELLSGCADRYEQEAADSERLVPSDESHDRVREIRRESPESIRVFCTNGDLGLRIEKYYSLKSGEFAKETAYYAADGEIRLLRVYGAVRPGAALADATLYNGYNNLEQPGDKLFAPVTAGGANPNYQGDGCRAMVFAPARKLGVAVYKFGVNGRYELPLAYRMAGRHDADAVIVPFDQDFCRTGEPFRLEVRYCGDFDGDPLRWFDHYWHLPEVRASLASDRPEWLDRMDFFSDVIGFGPENLDLTAPTNEWNLPDGERLKQTPALFADDGFLPLTIWLWNRSGDYPSQGNIGFGSLQLPAEALRRQIAALHALSPRLKVSLYTTLRHLSFASPLGRMHPDWLLRDKSGNPVAGRNSDEPDQIGVYNILAPGLTDSLLEQQVGLIRDYGADFLYVDEASNCTTGIDWRQRRVIHAYHWCDFWRAVGREIRKVNPEALIWGNTGLYAAFDAGFFENSYDWEWRDKADWRNMAAAFTHVAMQKQPGMRIVPLYWRWGGLGWQSNEPSYPNRLLAYGMVAGRPEKSAPWLEGVKALAARRDWIERAAKLGGWELAGDVKFSPSWWRGETDTVEITVLRAPHDSRSYLVNLISHRGYTFQKPPPGPGDDTKPKPDYGKNTETVETVELRLDAASLGFAPDTMLTVERLEMPPLPQCGPPQVAPQPWRREGGDLALTVDLAQERLTTIAIHPEG